MACCLQRVVTMHDERNILVREATLPDTMWRRATITLAGLFAFQAGLVCATAYVLRLLAS